MRFKPVSLRLELLVPGVDGQAPGAIEPMAFEGVRRRRLPRPDPAAHAAVRGHPDRSWWRW